MFKSTVSIFLAIMMLGSSVSGGALESNQLSNGGTSYGIDSYISKIVNRKPGKKPVKTTAQQETTTEQRTTVAPETTTEEKTTVPETTTEETTTVAETTTEAETTEAETVTEPETTIEMETTTEEETTTEVETTTEEETTTEAEKTTEAEITTEEEATTEAETTTEQETEAEENEEHTEEIYRQISRYEEIAAEEAEWLWGQQMSNGAFAFYNAENGSVHINPYFSEIVAIALINHDNSDEAADRMKDYFEWHFSHINTEETDYNGLAGTIYDYDVVVKNGIVVSETSKGTYDSTDSYSALFVKALAGYAKAYGDKSYLLQHKEEIKNITNVMFATMSGGYTYAKPDYKIRYLMDNAEVYAGLTSAKYIYKNVIVDEEMYNKVSEAVAFYDEHFNEHWWKGDHYATVLNSNYSEYTGYGFSWDMLYPCASSQIFPVIYGLVDADSVYAEKVYEGFCSAWNWQDMDYISKGETVFCWGSFSYMGALMHDEERLDSYMDKYNEIVEGGRKYPLFSSESAMVLMASDEIIQYLQSQITK